jgi:hypothetical protein
VPFSGPLRDHQLGGDLLVAAAPGEQAGHLQFPQCERRTAIAGHGQSRPLPRRLLPPLARRLLQGVGERVLGGQPQAAVVGGPERLLAQGLPGLPATVPAWPANTRRTAPPAPAPKPVTGPAAQAATPGKAALASANAADDSATAP